MLQSDNYFSFFDRRSTTYNSSYSLDKYKKSTCHDQSSTNLQASFKCSKTHEKVIKKNCNGVDFRKWLFYLNEGYNIILYGLGSKRRMLERFKMFISTNIVNTAVLVIYGFSPIITIKDILDSLAKTVYQIPVHTTGIYETLNIIEQATNNNMQLPKAHVYLIIHNIDGLMLRNERAHGALCRLSSLPNLHLLASIDHISTGLSKKLII